MENNLKLFFFIFLIFSIKLHNANCIKTGCPKWDGLVDLQEAGLPTPQGNFIPPYSPEKIIFQITNEFIKICKTDLIALRPDGINGIGKTPPGINIEKQQQEMIIDQLIKWSSQGYGVTIVETYNRFNYDFCCNVLLDESGNFTIEFVGPGFDGGDLNKSILKPTMIIKNKPESPIFIYSDPISKKANVESLELFYFRIEIESRVPLEQEVCLRLNYITETLLPDMKINIEKTNEATIKWLKQNKCARLLQQNNLRNQISFSDLQNIIFYSSVYANCHIKSKNPTVLTAHKYLGKIVFFGTHNSKKWGTL